MVCPHFHYIEVTIEIVHGDSWVLRHPNAVASQHWSWESLAVIRATPPSLLHSCGGKPFFLLVEMDRDCKIYCDWYILKTLAILWLIYIIHWRILWKIYVVLLVLIALRLLMQLGILPLSNYSAAATRSTASSCWSCDLPWRIKSMWNNCIEDLLYFSFALALL